MATTFAIEATLLGRFWYLAQHGAEEAERIMGRMGVEVFSDEAMGAAYGHLCDRLAAGLPCGGQEVSLRLLHLLGVERLATVDEAAVTGQAIGYYVRRALESWRARRHALYLADAATEAARLAGESPDRTAAHAEVVADRLAAIHTATAEDRTPQTRDELVDAEHEVMSAGGVDGIRWPYPVLHRICGPILPGECVGITGYPGTGKSLVAANLFNGWLRMGVPVLAFPTEMRAGWLRRAWSAESRVRQEIAERMQWGEASEAERERYARAVEWSRGLPWEVVNRSEFTPAEVAARARVLRRRYPGQHVLVVVDHMHNLVYPHGEVDRHVGLATKMLRELAQDDGDGGMSMVLLFQPRKPPTAEDRYKAVRAHQIRGQVEQVLDTHISPFRRYVKTMPHFNTAWGTASCLYDHRGLPEAADLEDPTGKPDDEHVYLKVDKRRIGGEHGPIVMLNIEGPTGHIYEHAADREAANV
jgi:replicative DNA helicase